MVMHTAKSSLVGQASLVAALLAAAAFSGWPLPARAYPGQELSKEAKITLSQARAEALKARPGTITSEELEKEKGGSGLRYSFDVKSGSRVYEVGVDARTGAILENDVDNGRD
ncbi:MAG TPA: PepSY domain-containing protein [Stellaceae bacterium]|nr:PepSY domain-containing protein [Stellaceae bacterium]